MRLILTDVYAAGEPPIVAADGRALARALRVAGKVEPVFVEQRRPTWRRRSAPSRGTATSCSRWARARSAAYAATTAARSRMNMVEPRHFVGLRGNLTLDAPLARYTSWRAGGCADIAYIPADRDDLALFLRQLPIFEAVTVLGLGSNVLVRDGGVRGAVVLLHNPGGAMAVADGLIYADAGVACPKLARFAARHGCAGAEFLAGSAGHRRRRAGDECRLLRRRDLVPCGQGGAAAA